MRIAVGCDHAGFPLKAVTVEELTRLLHESEADRAARLAQWCAEPQASMITRSGSRLSNTRAKAARLSRLRSTMR